MRPEMTDEIVIAATKAVRENLGKSYVAVASYVLNAIWPLLEKESGMKLSEAITHWRAWFERQVAKHGQCGGYTDFQEYVNAQDTFEVLGALVFWGEDNDAG